MATTIPKLIEQLLERKFHISIIRTEFGVSEKDIQEAYASTTLNPVTINDIPYAYNVEGGTFYKSGDVTIIPLPITSPHDDEEEYLLIMRGENRVIGDFNEFAMENLRWWEISKDRHDGWASPHELFLPYFIEKGWVKSTTVTTWQPVIKRMGGR